MIDETLEYYRPIPEAPGYSVSRDGEVIDQHGSPAGTLVYSPWGDVAVRLMVEGAPVIKSPRGWAALAWAIETPEHRAQRLKLEQLRQRVAAAEAIVLKSKSPAVDVKPIGASQETQGCGPSRERGAGC